MTGQWVWMAYIHAYIYICVECFLCLCVYMCTCVCVYRGMGIVVENESDIAAHTTSMCSYGVRWNLTDTQNSGHLHYSGC